MLLVLAVAGFFLFASRYQNLQPEARFEITIDRDQASNLAQDHLLEHGSLASEIRVDNVSFRSSSTWSAYLQSEATDPSELRAFRPEAWWDVILSSPAFAGPARVRLTASGEVFSVERSVSPGQVGARIEAPRAQAIARTFFRDVAGVELEGWTLAEARVNRLPDRSDHTLRWTRALTEDPETFQVLSMLIAGDRIGSWSRSMDVSPSFEARIEPRQSVRQLLDLGAFVLVTLVWLAALVVFALRFRSSEVGLKNGFLMVFVLLLTYTWVAFNVAPYAAHSAILEADNPLLRVVLYLGIGMQIFFTALGLFFVWNAGESVAREVWPAKLANFDRVFAQRFFSRSIGAGILRGAAMACITLGLWYLLLPLFAEGRWTTMGSENLQHLSAGMPLGFPLGTGALRAILTTAYAHLFTLGVIKLRFKRTWPAVLMTAIVFGAFFSETTVILDWPVEAMLSILVGLVSYLFLLRYDLWTVMTGTFFTGALLASMLYVVHPAFLSAGMLSLALLTMIVGYGALAVARGAEIDDKTVTPTYVRFISERERLKLELDIARQAQLRMLPATLPKPSGLEVAAFSEPAREVGGDYFDFMEFDENRLGIVVGDVSGKGMPAALYMTMLKGYLQSRSETDDSPLSVLSHVNRIFGQSSERNMFATMVYCVLNVDQGVLTFARAGHCPVLVFRDGAASVYVLQPPGIGIGLERTDLFERVTKEETMELRGGDVIVLYSDGLTEARDTNGNEFGRQRLIDLVRSENGSAEAILSRIRAAHNTFSNGQEPHDDVTCVVVRLVA